MTSAVWIAGLAFAWIGMLGLLWRRSLIGMLVGVLFGWIAVVLIALGRGAPQTDAAGRADGATLVLCLVLVGGLQVVLGLSIVVARIARRGSLDAEEAGLLEG